MIDLMSFDVDLLLSLSPWHWAPPEVVVPVPELEDVPLTPKLFSLLSSGLLGAILVACVAFYGIRRGTAMAQENIETNRRIALQKNAFEHSFAALERYKASDEYHRLVNLRFRAPSEDDVPDADDDPDFGFLYPPIVTLSLRAARMLGTHIEYRRAGVIDQALFDRCWSAFFCDEILEVTGVLLAYVPFRSALGNRAWAPLIEYYDEILGEGAFRRAHDLEERGEDQ